MDIEVPQMDPEFAQKREQWIRCLDHKDPATGQTDTNGIDQQMLGLIWDAGVYRVINEARRLADRDAKDQAKLSGLVHGLINRCFFRSQMIGIRKVVGSDRDVLDGRHGVFALKPLVKDMKEHRHLFSRSNLFAARGLSMDIEAVARARDRFVREQERAGHDAYYYPKEISVSWVDDLHREVDDLCCTTPESRGPDDVIVEDVFDGLLARLSETQSLADHVNKFLAHAATPESRALVDPGSEQVTLAQLWKAHEIICRAVQFIDVRLLRGVNHGFLPIYQGNLLHYVDQPLATTERLPDLRQAWAEYRKETEAWGHTGLDWVLRSPRSP